MSFFVLLFPKIELYLSQIRPGAKQLFNNLEVEMTLEKLRRNMHKIITYCLCYMGLVMLVAAAILSLSQNRDGVSLFWVVVFFPPGFISALLVMSQYEALSNYIVSVRGEKSCLKFLVLQQKEINNLLGCSDEDIQGMIKKATLCFDTISVDIAGASCDANEVRNSLQDSLATIEKKIEKEKETKIKPPLIVRLLRSRLSEEVV